jgi:hypothetical protein
VFVCDVNCVLNKIAKLKVEDLAQKQRLGSLPFDFSVPGVDVEWLIAIYRLLFQFKYHLELYVNVLL